MRRGLIGCVLALCALVAPSSTAWASFPGTSMGFGVASVGAGYGVQRIDLAAPHATSTLSKDDLDYGSPRFSPDGQRIAGSWKGDVVVMGADGSGRTTLVDGDTTISALTWSPDGSQIAFARRFGDTGPSTVYVVPASGGEPVKLFEREMVVGSLDWSARGELVFYEQANTLRRMLLIDANGQNPREVAGCDVMGMHPRFSPDGTRIAFTGLPGNAYYPGIYVMGRDGVGCKALVAASTSNNALPSMVVSWTPDGTRVVGLQANGNIGYSIRAWTPDGASVVDLHPQPGNPPISDVQPLGGGGTPTPPNPGGNGGGGPELQPGCAQTATAGPLVFRGCATTRAGGVKRFTGDLLMSGLGLRPAKGVHVDVDERTDRVTSSGNVTVQLAGHALLPRPLRLDVAAKDLRGGKLPIGTLFKNDGSPLTTDDDVEIGGLPVTAVGELAFSPKVLGGSTSVSAQVELPFTKWGFGDKGTVEGSTTLRTSNDAGFQLEQVKVKFGGLDVKGLPVGGGTFSYGRDDEDAEVWTAAIKVPLGPKGTALGQPKSVDGTVTLRRPKNGTLGLKELGAAANYQIGPILQVLFLQRIGVALGLQPPSLTGDAKISAGPEVLGVTALSMDGSVTVAWKDACNSKRDASFMYESKASIQVMDQLTLSESRFCAMPGYAQFGGKVDVSIPGAGMHGDVDGWVDGRDAFQAKGGVQVRVLKLEGGGEGALSSAGFGACAKTTPFTKSGFTQRWKERFPDLMLRSCSLREVKVQQRSARLRAAGTAPVVVDVPAGVPGVQFDLQGTAGAPRVEVTDPSGERFVVDVPADQQSVATERYTVATEVESQRSFLAVDSPRAGRWTIAPLADSPPMEAPEVLVARPDAKVSARIVRRGGATRLAWSMRAAPGRTLQLVERGENVARVLVTTPKASGQVPLVLTRTGTAARRIEAVVVDDGVPTRTTTVVRRVNAPLARTAQAPQVALRRKGGDVVVLLRGGYAPGGVALQVRIGGRAFTANVDGRAQQYVIRAVPRPSLVRVAATARAAQGTDSRPRRTQARL